MINYYIKIKLLKIKEHSLQFGNMIQIRILDNILIIQNYYSFTYLFNLHFL